LLDGRNPSLVVFGILDHLHSIAVEICQVCLPASPDLLGRRISKMDSHIAEAVVKFMDVISVEYDPGRTSRSAPAYTVPKLGNSYLAKRLVGTQLHPVEKSPI